MKLEGHKTVADRALAKLQAMPPPERQRARQAFIGYLAWRNVTISQARAAAEAAEKGLPHNAQHLRHWRGALRHVAIRIGR